MGSHYSGASDIRLALNTYIKFERAHSSFSKTLADRSPVFRTLTESQFGILDALFFLGPMSQKELGIKILKSKGDVTHVINRLLEKQLVTKQISAVDKRSCLIELSSAGKETAEKLMHDHYRSITEIFSSLTEEEQILFGSLCKKLGNSPQ